MASGAHQLLTDGPLSVLFAISPECKLQGYVSLMARDTLAPQYLEAEDDGRLPGVDVGISGTIAPQWALNQQPTLLAMRRRGSK